MFYGGPYVESLSAYSGYVALGLLISWLVCEGAVRTVGWHGRFSLDSTFGVQKFHHRPTPRIGGVGIWAGVWLVWLAAQVNSSTQASPWAALLGTMVLASVPAFAFGLIEDFTKRVSVRARLLATFASGLLAIALSGIYLTRVNVVGLDALFTWVPLAILFTVFAIGGVANAVNIVDGFNGLSSGAVVIALTAMGGVAWQVHDPALAMVCAVLVGVVLGFMVVNFPLGRIFLGDGGAYALGFMLAWVAILLPMRNPDVSVWCGLLACAYPVLEVGFTIVRRMRRDSDPGQPDRLHLHSLVKGRWIKKRFFKGSPALNNAFVAPLMWAYALVPALWAYAWPTSSPLLALGLLLAAGVYQLLYSRLVRLGRKAVRRSTRPAAVPTGAWVSSKTAAKR